MHNTVEMRNVKENIGMGDKKRSTKGVSPHLFVALTTQSDNI
jgi:hypothetical protein